MLSRRSTIGKIFQDATPEEIAALLQKKPEVKEEKNFIVKIRTNTVYRWKFFRTFWIWWSFLVFGWIYSQVGPTLPDLQLLLDIGLQTASWLFTSFSFGYMIGCLLFGLVDGKVNTALLLSFCQFGTAIFTTAVPWCPTLWLMLVMRVLMGICLGGLDSGSHAELFSIWKVHTASYVQVMYFNFGLGGLVSPIATKYFMAPEIENGNTTSINGGIVVPPHDIYSAINVSQFKNITNATVITELAKPVTHVQWAFLISGVLSFTAGAGYLASYISAKRHPEEEAIINAAGEHQRKRPSRPVFLLVMVVLTILLLLITGWIDTFAGFLTTFCIRELGWSKDTGVLATSVFWIAFCVANFLTIFLLQCFSTETLIFAYFILSMISFVGLLLSSFYKVVSLVWLSITLIGVSMSIMWPAMFAWTEEVVTEVSRKISSLFLVAGGVGLMVNPLILGYLMDHVAELWFVYLLMGEGIFIFAAFTFIAIIYRQLDPPMTAKSEDGLVDGHSYSNSSYTEDGTRASAINSPKIYE